MSDLTRFSRAAVAAVVLAAVIQPTSARAASDDPPRPTVAAERPSPRKTAPTVAAPAGKLKADRAVARTRKAGQDALSVQRTANTVAAARTGAAALAGAAAPATSTAANGGGDYSATPLAQSSSWSAGGSSGDFSWSYPLRVPPTAAGPAPKLALAYSSGVVDGRTSNTNNQSSLLGEGFGITSSYITRQYQSCKEDGQSGKYDQCWKFDNASLVLNGKSSELVQVSDSAWHLKEDDGTKVERIRRTGTPPGAAAGTSWNGDNDSEYWVVTTPDGIAWHFGMNILPGATSTSPKTNSAWTVPVAGDDAGEPCRPASSPTFATSFCNQAWRWSLDYVVDLSGNAMTHWYTQETNHYGKNGATTANTSYVRGGYPVRTDYGLRSTALFAQAPQKVSYTVAERCLAAGSGCDSLTSATKQNWPDVPFDSVCAQGSTCQGKASPTFFTRKRLTAVTTAVLNGTTYRDVDSWAFTHLFLDPGDTGDATDQSLWLSSLRQTGKAGTAITMPTVDFSHVYLQNRVDGTADDVLPINKPRLYTVTSELGSVTTVNYLPADCTPTNKPSGSEDTNQTRCYPSYWYKNGATTASIDWFQKYPVASVEQSDPTGGSPPVFTAYSYTRPAWHYDTSPLTLSGQRTWSDWRGFGVVTTTVGSGTVRSKSATYYLQGMSGNRRKDGTTPAVSMSGLSAPAIDDRDEYSGFARETVSYDGATVKSGSVLTPWSSQTASKTYPDSITVKAFRIDTGAKTERQLITSGSTPRMRTRTTTSTFDSLGYPVTAQDAGDDAVTGDETCTRTWYARNTSLNILSLVSRTRTTGVACASETAAALPHDSTTQGILVSDRATAFDSATTWSSTQTPTRGLAAWKGRAASYDTAGAPTWQTVQTSTYDALGRPLVVRDAAAQPTTTAYTPTGAGPVTSVQQTNALNHVTTTTYDPAWNLPLLVTDANGKVTETAYDALGRVTSIWLPQDPRATATQPAHAFAYGVNKTSPSWASTTVASAGHSTAYQFYDAQARTIQTQQPSSSPQGGTVVTDTVYDDRGKESQIRADVWVSGAPSSTRVSTNDVAPSITVKTYDALGREVSTSLKGFGSTLWTTSKTYLGDVLVTTAKAGGSALRETYDARDRLVSRQKFAAPTATGTSLDTSFEYTAGGLVKRVAASDGSVWTTGYDVFGRKRATTDPDVGQTTITYTARDDLESSTDQEGRRVVTTYDALRRRTGTYNGSVADANRLTESVYDTYAAGGSVKGHLTRSIRYVGGKPGTAYERRVVSRDAGYRVTQNDLVLPSTDPLVTAGVPATLRMYNHYDKAGIHTNSVEPAVAGLPTEVVTRDYTSLKVPLGLRGTTGYVQSAAYTALGDLATLTLATSAAAGTPTVTVSNTYEPTTRRLATTTVSDTSRSVPVLGLSYTRDTEGNVLGVTDTTGTTTDRQCFAYDGQQRLTEAWTPSGDCASTRSAGSLSGPAPYWTSYSYTGIGLRNVVTDHATGGDTSTTYSYAGGAGVPKHALTGTSTTGPTPSTATYAYDRTGNTTSRPGPAGQQTMTWDTEGRLARSAWGSGASARSTDYLYDSDGQLLIRRPGAGDGETVLYIGATEVHLRTVGGVVQPLKGHRTYSFAGHAVAVRTATAGTSGSVLSFIAGNNQDTASVALNASTMAVVKRYVTPFGGRRGTAVPWIDDKGFLGRATDDATGLTHIGAREYDPGIGRFVSVDPLIESEHVTSLTGYAYAANSPVTSSDPSGLCTPCEEIFEAMAALAALAAAMAAEMAGGTNDSPDRPSENASSTSGQNPTIWGRSKSVNDIAGMAADMTAGAYAGTRASQMTAYAGVLDGQSANHRTAARSTYESFGRSYYSYTGAEFDRINTMSTSMVQEAADLRTAVRASERYSSQAMKGAKVGGVFAAVGVGLDIANGKPAAQAITSGAASFAASVAVGAAIGTMVPIPVVGTVAGALVGAAVGAFTSGAVDSFFKNGPDAGAAVNSGLTSMGESVMAVGGLAKDAGGAVGGAVAGAWNSLFG